MKEHGFINLSDSRDGWGAVKNSKEFVRSRVIELRGTQYELRISYFSTSEINIYNVFLDIMC